MIITGETILSKACTVIPLNFVYMVCVIHMFWTCYSMICCSLFSHCHLPLCTLQLLLQVCYSTFALFKSVVLCCSSLVSATIIFTVSLPVIPELFIVDQDFGFPCSFCTEVNSCQQYGPLSPIFSCIFGYIIITIVRGKLPSYSCIESHILLSAIAVLLSSYQNLGFSNVPIASKVSNFPLSHLL